MTSSYQICAIEEDFCYVTIETVASLYRTVSFAGSVVSFSSFGQTESLCVKELFDFGDLVSE